MGSFAVTQGCEKSKYISRTRLGDWFLAEERRDCAPQSANCRRRRLDSSAALASLAARSPGKGRCLPRPLSRPRAVDRCCDRSRFLASATSLEPPRVKIWQDSLLP